MVFGDEGISSYHWQTQETAKVIIALADRADASTEQNTWRQKDLAFTGFCVTVVMTYLL